MVVLGQGQHQHRQVESTWCGEAQFVLGAGAGEVGGCPVGDDAAVIDDRDVVGEFLGLVHQMGREQDGCSVGPEPVDEFPHDEAGVGIESGGRFVEEDQFGAADDRAGEG